MTSLPSTIGNFEHLELLHVSNNKLQNIPNEIVHLKKLKGLTLSDNPDLSTLPDNMETMTSLHRIKIKNTQIPSEKIAFAKLPSTGSIQEEFSQILDYLSGDELEEIMNLISDT